MLLWILFNIGLQWPYGDICGITPVGKGQGTEFNLTFRKGSGKKSETLKFSTEHRTELLTEALVRNTALLWTQMLEDDILENYVTCFIKEDSVILVIPHHPSVPLCQITTGLITVMWTLSLHNLLWHVLSLLHRDSEQTSQREKSPEEWVLKNHPLMFMSCVVEQHHTVWVLFLPNICTCDTDTLYNSSIIRKLILYILDTILSVLLNLANENGSNQSHGRTDERLWSTHSADSLPNDSLWQWLTTTYWCFSFHIYRIILFLLLLLLIYILVFFTRKKIYSFIIIIYVMLNQKMTVNDFWG